MSALEWSLAGVGANVCHHTMLLGERFSAMCALEWLFACVDTNMLHHIGPVGEAVGMSALQWSTFSCF